MPDFSDLSEFFQRYGASVIGAAASLVGLVMLVRIQLIASGLRDWATTNAVVRRAELVFERDYQHNMGTYVPKVRYEFTVNGATFEGTRLSPTGDVSTSIKSDMESKIAGLQVGAVTPVYYDPRNPRRCALTLQPDGITFAALLLVGGAAVAVGAWMFGG